MPFISNYNYFGDQDYSDYRELICYERPTSVLLHYEYDVTYLRLWLYDRFYFTWKDGAFCSRSNAFDHFLKSNNIVSECTETVLPDQVEELLNNKLDSGSKAVLINYFSKIGESIVVSTLMIEKNEQGLLATSLRGDSFYVRKPIHFLELKEKLYFEEGKINYFIIRIPEIFLRSIDKSLLTIAKKFQIIESFKSEIQNYKTNFEDEENVGSKGLKAAFKASRKDFLFWKKRVNEGFDNALLVNLFWPIQFAYKPFLVFLGYIERNELLNLFLDSVEVNKLNQIGPLLLEINQKSEVLSSMGILFGKKPSENRFTSFIERFEDIINDYEKIESILLGITKNSLEKNS